jgi:hypothetical protein
MSYDPDEEGTEPKSLSEVVEARKLNEVARALCPYVYPQWPGRWGWTEATSEMRAECLRQAKLVLTHVEPQSSGGPDAA